MHSHHKAKNMRFFFVKKPVNKYRNTREPGDIAKGRSHLKEEPHTAARSWKKRTLNMHRHSINTFETISVPWLQLCFLHKRVTRPNKFSCFFPNKTTAERVKTLFIAVADSQVVISFAGEIATTFTYTPIVMMFCWMLQKPLMDWVVCYTPQEHEIETSKTLKFITFSPLQNKSN